MINNFSPVSLPWRDTLRKFDRGEFPGLVFKKAKQNLTTMKKLPETK